MATLTWLLCDFRSGRRLATLPIVADDTLKYRIAVVDQLTVRLPLTDPDCPRDWHSLLARGRRIVVAAIDDEPAQAWFVEVDEIGSHDVPLTLKSLETCLERTNVPSYDQGTADDVTAAAALCAPLVDRFGFTIDATPSTAPGGEGWWDELEDRTVLDAVNELMEAGGIEWRLRFGWTDGTHRVLVKTVEIAPRIGEDRTHVVFDRDADGNGNIETYRRLTSYAAGKGATALQGVGDGSGPERPMTDVLVSALVAEGWPMWLERKTFTDLSPDADVDAELARRTAELAPQRERGTVTWELSCTPAAGRPGRDYQAGDTVGLEVAATTYDPEGGRTRVRLIGWEYDTNTGVTKPVLWEENPDG